MYLQLLKSIVFGDPIDDLVKVIKRGVSVCSCSIKPAFRQTETEEKVVANIVVHMEFLIFFLYLTDAAVGSELDEANRKAFRQSVPALIAPELADFLFRPDSLAERRERVAFINQYVEKHAPAYYKCPDSTAAYERLGLSVAGFCYRGRDADFASWVVSLTRKTCDEVRLDLVLGKVKKSNK